MRGLGLAILVLAGCGVPEPSHAVDWPPPVPALPLPDDTGEYVSDGDPTGGWRVRPISAPVEHGVSYEFTLQHCGLASPIDVDGSFWDPVEARSRDGLPVGLDGDGELINATSGVIAVIGDEARFRTESGTVVRLVRHHGAKEFEPCL